MLVCSAAIAACTLVLGLQDGYYVDASTEGGSDGGADAIADAGFDAPSVVPWVLTLESSFGPVKILDMAIDPTTGDVGLTGYFTTQIDVSDGTHMTSDSSRESAFFLRLDANGKVSWRDVINANQDLHGNAIGFAKGDIVYTASGYVSCVYVIDQIAQDAGKKQWCTANTQCGYGGFIGRADRSGNTVGNPAAFCGPTFSRFAYDEATDRLAATGFLQAGYVNDVAPDGGSLPINADKDVLVVLFANDGSRVFARSFGTPNKDRGLGVAFGKDQGLYVTGLAYANNSDGGSSSITFDDAGSAGGLGYDDGFVIRLDANGNVTNLIPTGNGGFDDLQGIAPAASNLVLAGSMKLSGAVGDAAVKNTSGNWAFYLASVQGSNVENLTSGTGGVETYAGSPSVAGDGRVLLPLLATASTMADTTLKLGGASVDVPQDLDAAPIGVVSSWSPALDSAVAFALPSLLTTIPPTPPMAVVHGPTGNLVVSGLFDRSVTVNDASITPENDGGVQFGSFVAGYGKWP